MKTQSEISVDILSHPVELHEARLLHADRYIKAGYVDHLSPRGTIDDEWVVSSTYFGARDRSGVIVGVCRLIPHTPAVPMPVLRAFQLDPSARRWLSSFGPGELSEVSALAVAGGCGMSRGVRVIDALFGAMTCHAVETGAAHWVAAIDRRVHRHLTRLHGFRLEPLGPERHYLGSATVPVRIDLQAQLLEYNSLSPNKLDEFMIDLTGDQVRLRHEHGDRRTSRVDRRVATFDRRRGGVERRVAHIDRRVAASDRGEVRVPVAV